MNIQTFSHKWIRTFILKLLFVFNYSEISIIDVAIRLRGYYMIVYFAIVEIRVHFKSALIPYECDLIVIVTNSTYNNWRIRTLLFLFFHLLCKLQFRIHYNIKNILYVIKTTSFRDALTKKNIVQIISVMKLAKCPRIQIRVII